MPSPACWSCRAPIPASRAEVESVIQARAASEGGPFLTMSCPKCRTRCGALRNRRGEWMLYPLEGATEPTLIDRLLPRTSRAQLEKARAWWTAHSGDVERFRAARPARRPRRDPDAAPPPPRRKEPPRAAEPPRGGPRDVLGVGPQATLRDVQKAWRAAVKRWHPDRIPTQDPVVLHEAHLRFQEMRAAYEALVAELGGGSTRRS